MTVNCGKDCQLYNSDECEIHHEQLCHTIEFSAGC